MGDVLLGIYHQRKCSKIEKNVIRIKCLFLSNPAIFHLLSADNCLKYPKLDKYCNLSMNIK